MLFGGLRRVTTNPAKLTISNSYSVYKFLTDGFLNADESKKYRQEYRLILKKGEKESPPPDETKKR